MITVLHLIKSLGRGGAETLLTETLSAHDETRFTSGYAYFLPWKNQLVAALEAMGATVTLFPVARSGGILLKAPAVAQFVKARRVDILHCHLPLAGVCGRLASCLRNVPVVYTEHNTQDRYHFLTRWANLLTLGLNACVIAVSDEVAASIRKYKGPDFPVRVVRNGVSLQRFDPGPWNSRSCKARLGIDPDDAVIGTVCVFRTQKRLNAWLEIAVALAQHHPRLRFVLVGDGPLMPQVRQWVAEAGLQDRVLLAGVQEDVRPYLAAMDLFMMTSEFEGLPIAMLEAMAMERVVLATKAGGIAEVIEHGRNGFLVDRAAPLQLVGIATRLLGDSPLRLRIGANARARVRDRFSVERMVGELESVYSGLTPQRSEPATRPSCALAADMSVGTLR